MELIRPVAWFAEARVQNEALEQRPVQGRLLIPIGIIFLLLVVGFGLILFKTQRNYSAHSAIASPIRYHPWS